MYRLLFAAILLTCFMLGDSAEIAAEESTSQVVEKSTLRVFSVRPEEYLVAIEFARERVGKERLIAMEKSRQIAIYATESEQREFAKRFEYKKPVPPKKPVAKKIVPRPRYRQIPVPRGPVRYTVIPEWDLILIRARGGTANEAIESVNVLQSTLSP